MLRVCTGNSVINKEQPTHRPRQTTQWIGHSICFVSVDVRNYSVETRVKGGHLKKSRISK